MIDVQIWKPGSRVNRSSLVIWPAWLSGKVAKGLETSPERAVVGSRLTAYEPFGSLRAVSVSCRYSVIRICVAEVEAASCWGLSTKPPMGYGHPKCRSPAGRMYDGGVYAAVCPGGVIEPPVTADCFGKRTSWGC